MSGIDLESLKTKALEALQSPGSKEIVGNVINSAVQYVQAQDRQKNSYLIGLDPLCTPSNIERMMPMLSNIGISVDWDYRIGSDAYGMKITYMGPTLPTSLLNATIPCVKYIEDDAFLRDFQAPPNLVSQNACIKSQGLSQQSLWGLDVMDGSYDGKYSLGLTGEGVNIYMLDSGIKADHSEFTGRARNIFTSQAIKDSSQSTADCTGHGTHVAGIVGGNTVGIAKRANLFGLRIIGCERTGSVSDAIAALKAIQANLARPAVINLSLGTTDQANGQSLSDVITSLTRQNIPVVIAAGNSAADVCGNRVGSSLTTIPDTFVVGALDRKVALSYTPKIASFSNTGSCVKYWAPGEEIWSAANSPVDVSAENAFEVRRGTSQAAPMVTGAIALQLQLNPQATIKEIAQALNSQGRPLPWGGVHVFAPGGRGAPVANSTSQLSFPLSRCAASTFSFVDVLASSLGGSVSAVYALFGALAFLLLFSLIMCVQCIRRRRARKAVGPAGLEENKSPAPKPKYKASPAPLPHTPFASNAISSYPASNAQIPYMVSHRQPKMLQNAPASPMYFQTDLPKVYPAPIDSHNMHFASYPPPYPENGLIPPMR